MLKGDHSGLAKEQCFPVKPFFMINKEIQTFERLEDTLKYDNFKQRLKSPCFPVMLLH